MTPSPPAPPPAIVVPAAPSSSSSAPPGVVVVGDEDEDEVVARKVLMRSKGHFGDVFVVDEDGLILLRFGSEDGADQSAIDPQAPDKILFEYIRIAALGPALRTDGRPFRRALTLGLGGGAWPRLLLATDPRVVVDAVEIDPVVVDAAHRFFQLPESPRFNVFVDDAATWVLRPEVRERRYDVILLDAFSGEDIPAALTTPAFFNALKHILTDDGVLMVNVALVKDDDGRALVQRLATTFPDCSWASARQEENQVVFAGKRPISPGALRKAIAQTQLSIGIDVAADIDRVAVCAPPPPPPSPSQEPGLP